MDQPCRRTVVSVWLLLLTFAAPALAEDAADCEVVCVRGVCVNRVKGARIAARPSDNPLRSAITLRFHLSASAGLGRSRVALDYFEASWNDIGTAAGIPGAPDPSDRGILPGSWPDPEAVRRCVEGLLRRACGDLGFSEPAGVEHGKTGLPWGRFTTGDCVVTDRLGRRVRVRLCLARTGEDRFLLILRRTWEGGRGRRRARSVMDQLLRSLRVRPLV